MRGEAEISQHVIEVIMRSDPRPLNRIAFSFSYRSVLFADSHGPEPSVADSFRNASSFGRELVSAMICCQRSSASRASRNLAKSATSTRFACGSCSQMLNNSWVSALIILILLLRFESSRPNRSHYRRILYRLACAFRFRLSVLTVSFAATVQASSRFRRSPLMPLLNSTRRQRSNMIPAP